MGTSLELGDDFVQDPMKLYQSLRIQAPVCQVLLHGRVPAWLVTRHADALALFHDRRLSKDETRTRAIEQDRVPYGQMHNPNMLGSDPPRHTRLRKLVVRAFAAPVIDQLRHRVKEIADDLLDGIDHRLNEPVDLIAEYAAPLPIRVVSEMLGMSASYGQDFRSVAGPLLAMASNEEREAAERAVTKILEDVIERKRRDPADDLLSRLIQVSEDGSQLSHAELVSMAFLLLTAGYETSVNLIGNGVLALLGNPDQMDLLRVQPSLLPNTIEEVLRYDGPVNTATLRYTLCEVTVAGVTIPENEVVLISPLSANRDDAQFADPDRFDITRNTKGHLAFGHGIHVCLGANLARLEGTTAIGTLLDRYADITLASSTPLVYQSSTLMHGVQTLPVLLRKPRRPPSRTHPG
jgi:cytochrome P450